MTKGRDKEIKGPFADTDVVFVSPPLTGPVSGGRLEYPGQNEKRKGGQGGEGRRRRGWEERRGEFWGRGESVEWGVSRGERREAKEREEGRGERGRGEGRER